MQDYLRYIKKRFKHASPIYDLTFVPIRGVRKLTAELADIKRGEKVLDICTGTGEVALELSRRGANVSGIDISPEMLAIARRKDGEGKIEFIEVDSTSLPFRNGVFDLAVISFGLHEMPREAIISTIAEAKRVLKKDGRIVIADYVPKIRYPGNKILEFFGYLFLYFYECRYFRDYVERGIQRELCDAGLIVRKQKYAILRFMEVFLCELK